ncbi:MAG: hydroxysqualene dehydroxylase HpnE [Chloroflexota bacterium]|nr:hydroxysqualene dehydroxylase HpnE [Chloroflexota bacterium]
MRVAIIGAGLAGLAAGCELADAGHAVVLLERRPWAGGKAYSFTERETGEHVDNGQHIAMRCTTAYVRFLERIGSAHLVKWQPRMRIPVFDAAGRRSVLRADPLPAPLHLLPSFAAYRHLALVEKARVARGIVAIMRAGERPEHGSRSFGAWLRAHGQSERAIRDFWDLIVVPALNCRCDDASAQQALFVFREGFLPSPSAGAIGVPRVGLGRLHVEPAARYIEAHGGEVRTGAAVERIDVRDGEVGALLLASGERIACDACIAALPPRELLDVLPGEVRGGPPFDALSTVRTSPIVNLHLWFDGPVADFDFAAFTGCDLQWVFNRTRIEGEAGVGQEHMVLSLSAAGRFMPLGKQQLRDLLLPQLRRALPAAVHRTLLRCVAIKEPAATFVPAPGLLRPGARTPVADLFLAGAYTDTGWPATMESAVRSGIAAAAAVAATARTSERRQMAPVA